MSISIDKTTQLSQIGADTHAKVGSPPLRDTSPPHQDTAFAHSLQYLGEEASVLGPNSSIESPIAGTHDDSAEVAAIGRSKKI